jgi:hypothetical protein
MTKATKLKIVQVVALAEGGVDYSARLGARCPWCGQRTKVYSTRPWESDVRIRYHHCINSACVLAAMNKTVKSVQVEL